MFFSPRRCAVVGCDNSTSDDRNLTMFSFPVKNDERCKAWLDFCSNDKLWELPSSLLKRKSVCRHHFKDSDLMNASAKRLALIHTAVPSLRPQKKPPPSIYTELARLGLNIPKKNSTPVNSAVESKQQDDHGKSHQVHLSCHVKAKTIDSQGNSSSSSDSQEMHNGEEEIPITDDEQSSMQANCPHQIFIRRMPKVRRSEDPHKLQEQLKNLKKRFRQKSKEASYLRRKISMQGQKPKKLTREEILLAAKKYLNSNALFLLRMQLYHCDNVTAYTTEEKKFSLSLFSLGVKPYKLVRENGLALPSVSNVHRWLQENHTGLEADIDETINRVLENINNVESTQERSFDGIFSRELENVETISTVAVEETCSSVDAEGLNV